MSLLSRGEPKPVYCSRCGVLLVDGSTKVDAGYDPWTGQKNPDVINERLKCPDAVSHPRWFGSDGVWYMVI